MTSASVSTLGRLDVRGPRLPEHDDVLTPDALRFVEGLIREFGPRRTALLEARRDRQRRLDAGELPDFLLGTADIRKADWKVAPIPNDLVDRRVEITGPVERKMVINALNSGASVFMADFEDSNSPTWENIVAGPDQPARCGRPDDHLHQPRRQGVSAQREDGDADGPTARLAPAGEARAARRPADPRRRCSTSACTSSTTRGRCSSSGTGPYFYLPKLESHLEARLWNDVFKRGRRTTLGIPRGTIRATVLIETILAAFEMDEILYELRDHSAGLNCGRWDYIFSFIKKFSGQPGLHAARPRRR